MERILGPQMGDFMRALHEEHGVIFHLEDTASAIDGKRVKLKSGAELEADLVIVGCRRAPADPARRSGRAQRRSRRRGERLSRNERAGDLRGRRHCTLARSAQRRAHSRRALGGCRTPRPDRGAQHARAHEKFTAVPFFWSQHYDVPINYVGHAEAWDELKIEGDIPAKDCILRFNRNGRTLAVASIYRDVESLQAELAMESASA